MISMLEGRKRLGGGCLATSITRPVTPKGWNAGGRGDGSKRGLRAFLQRKAASDRELALEREIGFFGRLADTMRDPSALSTGLCHKDPSVRYHAARAAGIMAERGFDMSSLIPQLAAGLSDGDLSVRYHCAWALGKSASGGADISKAVGALGEMLSAGGDSLARSAAAFALCTAGESGADLNGVRDVLLAASNDRDDRVRRFASDALFCLRP